MMRPLLVLTVSLGLLLMPVGAPSAESGWTPTDLGSLDGRNSEGNAINNQGQVVGVSTTATGDHAFLWKKGAMTDLGTLGRRSVPTAINEHGQVVGRSDTTTGEERAFLWEDGAMTDLGTLRGGVINTTGAIKKGQQVGARTTTPITECAFLLWDNGVTTD